jgi:hypothetical protein
MGVAIAALIVAETSAQTGVPAKTPATSKNPPALAPPPPIYRVDGVPRVLTLRERQLEQLNAITERLQSQYQSQYERLASAPERERQARQMQLDREYTAAWLKGATDILDAQQLSRYQQLQLQYGGFATFNDPAVQKQLNLTEAQLKQLSDAMLWSNEQTQNIMRQAQTDATRARDAYSEFLRTRQQRLNDILTTEQRRSWSEMTGEAFPFPPPFPATTEGATPKR